MSIYTTLGTIELVDDQDWYWVAEHRLWYYGVPEHALRPNEHLHDITMAGVWIKPDTITELTLKLHGIRMSKQRGKTIWHI